MQIKKALFSASTFLLLLTTTNNLKSAEYKSIEEKDAQHEKQPISPYQGNIHTLSIEPNELQAQLLNSIYHKNFAGVKAALEQGADPALPVDWGINDDVYKGNLYFLFRLKLNKNYVSRLWSPLYLCAFVGNNDCFQLLKDAFKEKKFDISNLKENGAPLSHFACARNDNETDIFISLMQQPQSEDPSLDDERQNVLHIICSKYEWNHNYLSTARFIEALANLYKNKKIPSNYHTPDKFGNKPWDNIMHANNQKLLNYFKKYCDNFNKEIQSLYQGIGSRLHASAFFDLIECTKFLLLHKANANIPKKNGETPFVGALKHDRINIEHLQLLADHTDLSTMFKKNISQNKNKICAIDILLEKYQKNKDYLPVLQSMYDRIKKLDDTPENAEIIASARRYQTLYFPESNS